MTPFQSVLLDLTLVETLLVAGVLAILIGIFSAVTSLCFGFKPGSDKSMMVTIMYMAVVIIVLVVVVTYR